MNRTFNYKNRAPKIGSSTFFSNKQERAKHSEKQYFNNDNDEKFKRPTRTARRRNKDKESLAYGYKLLAKDYNDLTKFKTFITFLKKKDKLEILPYDNELLTPDTFENTTKDVEFICDVLAYRNITMSVGMVAMELDARLMISICFTNERIEFRFERVHYFAELGTTSTSKWGYIKTKNDFIDKSFYRQEDLTDNGEPIENNIKKVLMELSNNIKRPRYI